MTLPRGKWRGTGWPIARGHELCDVDQPRRAAASHCTSGNDTTFRGKTDDRSVPPTAGHELRDAGRSDAVGNRIVLCETVRGHARGPPAIPHRYPVAESALGRRA